MSFRTKKSASSLDSWTVGTMGAFFLSHNGELIAHAIRILRDRDRAEEVVQEAFMKMMLAGPELSSEQHALGYLHRTIENLCVDFFRAEGRRPNLVLLDEASNEIDLKWNLQQDCTENIIAAEDAAIVRQALALLSPAERAALVMWEIEGRSTREIARELGINEKSVRHTVSRARTSFKRVMSEIVIDETRGLTALDLLSKTYRKSINVAKKSSKVALSISLAIFAFLGLNTFNVDMSAKSNSGTNFSEATASSQADQVPGVVSKNTHEKIGHLSNTSEKKSEISSSNAKSTELRFAGLDKNGQPSGFTVADSTGAIGAAFSNSRAAVAEDAELSITGVFKTTSGAANIFITQLITSDANGLSYKPTIAYGSSGSWVPLVTKVASTELTRLLDGNYLLSAIVAVESVVESPIKVTASAGGRDLMVAPRQVITRLMLDPSKTQILSQAVLVVERGAR